MLSDTIDKLKIEYQELRANDLKQFDELEITIKKLHLELTTRQETITRLEITITEITT